MNRRLKVKVQTVAELTPRINAYELVRAESTDALPSFTAGSHITLHLPSGTERQYSLYNDPADAARYCIAVQREDGGRGGSLEVHRTLAAGRVLTISPPRNLFPLSDDARSAILLAGGIGITPILSMARHLTTLDAPFQLIYLARDRQSAAFLDEIEAIKAAAPSTLCHFDGGQPANAFDIGQLLGTPRPGAHVYCCGPDGLMNAVREAASLWPAGTVHFEYFSNEGAALLPGDRPFTVRLARSGRTIEIAEGQTILDALLAAGMDVDYSCAEGTCGTCIVPLLEGEADHRDRVLLPFERETKIAICCSRAKSGLIAIDL